MGSWRESSFCPVCCQERQVSSKFAGLAHEGQHGAGGMKFRPSSGGNACLSSVDFSAQRRSGAVAGNRIDLRLQSVSRSRIRCLLKLMRQNQTPVLIHFNKHCFISSCLPVGMTGMEKVQCLPLFSNRLSPVGTHLHYDICLSDCQLSGTAYTAKSPERPAFTRSSGTSASVYSFSGS